MKKLILLIVCLIVLSVSFMAAIAADTFTFNFQGHLSNASGETVPDGVYQIGLFAYTDSIGGRILWQELHPSVAVRGGFFNLEAGSLVPCSLYVASLDDVYIAVQIGTEPPMGRRFRINATPNSGAARRLFGDLESSPGALRFLDDGSIYMGVEPSPWNPGGSIKMYDSTGATSLEFASDGSASFIDDGSEYMGVEPSPFHAGGELVMKNASGVQTMVLSSEGTMSMLDDGSEYMGIEPSPWHAGGDLTMTSVGAGTTLLLASNGQVSIGTGEHTNILTIVRGSDTDPIADAWTTYSSRRWKTNIQPLQSSLAKVMQLQGVSYDQKEGGKHDIGLIAEDVGKVVPEVVAYEDNGVDAKSIDYARLTALLIEAVKEQQKTIEHQNVRIEKLENQLDKLSER